MPVIMASRYFVPLAAVPQIGDTTPIFEVLSLLSEQRAGGFILVSGGVPQYYVRGNHLAEVVFSHAADKDREIVGKENIRDLAGEGFSRLSKVRVEPGKEVSTEQDASELLKSLGDDISILPVLHEKQQVGWFFPSEVLLGTIHTPGTTWICQRCGTTTTEKNDGKCKCGGKLG